MSQGQFKTDDANYGAGFISIDGLHGAVKLVPSEDRNSDKAPTHEILLQRDKDGPFVSFGRCWKNEIKAKPGEYIFALEFDSPRWPKPIWVKGFQRRGPNGQALKHEFRFVWSRNDQSEERAAA